MLDTPLTGVQTGDGTGGDQSDEFFVATYKTKEATAAGIAEKDATISKLQSERDKAKSEGAKLNDILEKLTEAATARGKPDEPDPQEQIDEVVKQMAKAMEDGDYEAAARLQLQVNSGWIGQSEEQLKKSIKEQADSLGLTVNQLKAQMAERDPDVVAHSDAAKKLAESAGIDFDANRDTLIAIAKASAKTDQPARHDLPGGSETTRVVGRETAEPLTDAQKQLVGWNQLNDAQKAELKKKWEVE